jgi:hypothetical protein
VQLLDNAALKFDATFNVPAFTLDVGKRFARLIAHVLRAVPYCGLDWASIGHRMMPEAQKKPLLPNGIVRPAMSFEDDLRRVEEDVAEARRLVQRQKGLIVRLRAAGVNTFDAQRILWLLESNLRRFEQHRDRLRANVRQ